MVELKDYRNIGGKHMSIFSIFSLSTRQASTAIYRRCDEVREENGLSWSQFAKKAGLKLKSWMIGIPTSNPTDKELQAIASTYGVCFDWLKYGTEPKYSEENPEEE